MSEELIPVFVPPLALLLARAEKLKESPLTEAEIVRIRDDAVCIMMPPDKLQSMHKKRGFRDINPENCWVEWHRLRPQLTEDGYLPRIVLCLLGDSDFRQHAEPMLASYEYEIREHDERMPSIFQAMGIPDLTDEDYQRIAQHKSVLYVLSKNFTAEDAGDTAYSLMQLGQKLLTAGGIVLKCESSGAGHSSTSWMELTAAASQNYPDISSSLDHAYGFWSSLIHAYVRHPMAADDDYFSCGLHLLGQPDLIASIEMLESHFEQPVSYCLDLFRVFASYVLAECPPGTFAPGNTFAMDTDSPTFTLSWEPCTGYDEDEYHFNPFGMWRFNME